MTVENSNSITKLHTNGNSVLVTTGDESRFTSEILQFLLDQNRGIGANNLLLYRWPDDENFDVIVTGYNADCTRVGLCGNGARCLGWFLYSIREESEHLRQIDWSNLRMKMDDIPLTLSLSDAESQEFSMSIPPPLFDVKEIPFTGENTHGEIEVFGSHYNYVVINVGNPHCVLFVDEEPTLDDIKKIGPHLQNNTALFPEKANIELAFIRSPDEIFMRIYERGVGITSSSGSGSLATALAAIKYKGVNETVRVSTPGGSQEVNWSGDDEKPSIKTKVEMIFSMELPEVAL